METENKDRIKLNLQNLKKLTKDGKEAETRSKI